MLRALRILCQTRGRDLSTSAILGSPARRVPFVPNEEVSRRASKADARLEAALQTVIHADGALHGQLVLGCGFEVHRIRRSADGRDVYVLWDCTPGRHDACRQQLLGIAARLRNHLARLLRAKHTPYLHFIHDSLPPPKEAVAVALDAAAQELQQPETPAPNPPPPGPAAAAAGADRSAPAASDALESAAHAALQSLSQQMQLKRHKRPAAPEQPEE